jgi:tetratricopeptide (TPR) repeat protein
LTAENPPAEAWFLAGLLDEKEKECQEAISCFEKAIAESPGKWSLFVPFYRILKKCGQIKRAEHIRTRILSDPALVELWPAFK